MANIGFQGAWIAPYDETKGLNDVLTGKKYAKAVAMAVNNTTSEATLNADDGIDDSVKIITQANITYTPNGFSLEEEADVLGYTADSVTLGSVEGLKAYGQGTNTEGDLVTCAFMVPTRRSGIEAVRVLLYPKVKFSPEDSEDYQTKGENVNFATPGYTGKAFTDDAGNFRYKIGEFEDVVAAKAWLNTKFSITATNEEEETPLGGQS